MKTLLYSKPLYQIMDADIVTWDWILFFHQWNEISSNPAHNKACEVMGSLVTDIYWKREIFNCIIAVSNFYLLTMTGPVTSAYITVRKRSKYHWNWRLQSLRTHTGKTSLWVLFDVLSFFWCQDWHTRFSCTCDVNFRWTGIKCQDWVVVGGT